MAIDRCDCADPWTNHVGVGFIWDAPPWHLIPAQSTKAETDWKSIADHGV